MSQSQFDTNLLVAIILPSAFAVSVLSMFLAIWIKQRRTNRQMDLEALHHTHPNPNTFIFTKESFTSPKYANYGISIPSMSSLASSSSSSCSSFAPSLKSLPPPLPKAHYSTFSSRNRDNMCLPYQYHFGTSIILPPNAMNMHEKSMDSRSTLDICDLVLNTPHSAKY